MTVEQLRDLHKPRTWWKHPDAEDDDADHFPSEEAVRESVRRVFSFDEKPFSWDEQRLFTTTVDYCEGCMKVVFEACEPYAAPFSPLALWPCETIRALDGADPQPSDPSTKEND